MKTNMQINMKIIIDNNSSLYCNFIFSFCPNSIDGGSFPKIFIVIK